MGWGGEEAILEGVVDNSHAMEIYEPEAEKTANNAITKCRLIGSQYKLMRGNGKYSSERMKKIIEQEIPGMRKEIPVV